jgi:DNA-binding NarL/FixJ family response regulator
MRSFYYFRRKNRENNINERYKEKYLKYTRRNKEGEMIDSNTEEQVKQLLDTIMRHSSRHSVHIVDFERKQLSCVSFPHILFEGYTQQYIKEKGFKIFIELIKEQELDKTGQATEQLLAFYHSLPLDERQDSSLELSLQIKDKHNTWRWVSISFYPISFTAEGLVQTAVAIAAYSFSRFCQLAYIRNISCQNEYILHENGTWEKHQYENLDEREAVILQLTAQGYINKEIATQLQITESYIKKIKKGIYKKLHATNIHEAIGTASRMRMRYF